jgi:ketosteroid isomerase-like protein
MRTEDVEVAGAFLTALEEAAESGDREAVYPLPAPDVEWVTPKRTLRGIDEIREELTWGSPPEKLDLEFRVGDWVDLDERGVACDVHEIYRWKETGEVSYERDRRIELTIRNGKISRYETRIVG